MYLRPALLLLATLHMAPTLARQAVPDTLERRVAPLAATLLLWVALIDAVRLVAHAL